MPKLGPYSRVTVLAKLDKRTREWRVLAATRAELTAHVGGKPSATQRALIERAAWLTLHVALMDAKIMADPDVLATERDSRQYLAWSNSLARALRDLGIKEGRAKPSIDDYLSERSGS